MRQQLWSGELDWVSLPGDDLPQQARALDVFLAALAAQHHHRRLLEALLSDDDTEIARRTRTLRDAPSRVR